MGRGIPKVWEFEATDAVTYKRSNVTRNVSHRCDGAKEGRHPRVLLCVPLVGIFRGMQLIDSPGQNVN